MLAVLFLGRILDCRAMDNAANLRYEQANRLGRQVVLQLAYPWRYLRMLFNRTSIMPVLV